MSIATEVARISGLKVRIRNKLVSLGLAISTDNLSDLTTKIEAIVNNGSVTADVREGETYTIPAGFHDGTGTVSGVQGGGNYALQSKTVTPTKAQQAITPDAGKYGLSDVTVEPIPDAYQDVSSTTASAADVRTGSVFVAADGTTTVGSLADNGTLTLTIDGMVTDEVAIPAGIVGANSKVTLTSSIEEALAAI